MHRAYILCLARKCMRTGPSWPPTLTGRRWSMRGQMSLETTLLIASHWFVDLSPSVVSLSTLFRFTTLTQPRSSTTCCPSRFHALHSACATCHSLMWTTSQPTAPIAAQLHQHRPRQPGWRAKQRLLNPIVAFYIIQIGVTQGGEVGFAARMLAESEALQGAIGWYTCMLGCKASLAAVMKNIKSSSATKVRTTVLKQVVAAQCRKINRIEASQGKSHRWVVAWSFLPASSFVPWDEDIEDITGPTAKRRKPASTVFTRVVRLFVVKSKNNLSCHCSRKGADGSLRQAQGPRLCIKRCICCR